MVLVTTNRLPDSLCSNTINLFITARQKRAGSFKELNFLLTFSNINMLIKLLGLVISAMQIKLMALLVAQLGLNAVTLVLFCVHWMTSTCRIYSCVRNCSLLHISSEDLQQLHWAWVHGLAALAGPGLNSRPNLGPANTRGERSSARHTDWSLLNLPTLWGTTDTTAQHLPAI